MTKTNRPHSESLKNRVKQSGINLIVISQRSKIKYPRLRALINGKAKFLYDEGIEVEKAIQKSVSVIQQA